jgi:hypothetical protein
MTEVRGQRTEVGKLKQRAIMQNVQKVINKKITTEGYGDTRKGTV